MAQFTSFLDILPDPNNPIGNAGQAGGTDGPGFATVKLSSNKKTMVSKTNSGRSVARSIAGHTWKINITYNPMTRTEFEPIYSFLLSRLGRLNPFYVSLPQYRTPQNTAFNTYLNTSNKFFRPMHQGYGTVTTATGTDWPAGLTAMEAGGPGYNWDGAVTTTNGYPAPGDLFTVEDDDDSYHKKAYMVTRVETPTDYKTAIPQPSGRTNSLVRIHFTPPLTKKISDYESSSSEPKLIFVNPLIRVRLAKDVQEYSLGTDNLYKFSLQLEEALP